MIYESKQPANTDKIPMQKGAMDLSNVWRLRIGAGDSVFNISNGQLWAGSRSYDTGVFKLDLATGALTTTGTINATTGTFSGNINITSGGVFTFLADDGTTVLANIYSYASGSGGGGAKSVGINAATTSGEVKLTCGASTRLVAKTVSGKAVVEFYNTQRIYADEGSKLKFDSSLIPYTDNGADLGSSSKRWSRLYTKDGVTVDGDNGIGDSFGYKDEDGNTRYLVFKGGVLTDEHS
jgi:hypothetical protein